MLFFTLFIFGLIARFLVHAPNVTPILALALFAGVYLKKKSSWVLVILLMGISDLIIGPHNVIFFTWFAIIGIAILGNFLQTKKTILNIAFASIISPVFFFIISNFGVWFMGWYPHTLDGFIQCYLNAIPFFRNTFLSTIVYSAILFVCYELIAYQIKDIKLKRVLLAR